MLLYLLKTNINEIFHCSVEKNLSHRHEKNVATFLCARHYLQMPKCRIPSSNPRQSGQSGQYFISGLTPLPKILQMTIPATYSHLPSS